MLLKLSTVFGFLMGTFMCYLKASLRCPLIDSISNKELVQEYLKTMVSTPHIEKLITMVPVSETGLLKEHNCGLAYYQTLTDFTHSLRILLGTKLTN